MRKPRSEEPPHPYFGAGESRENWNFCRKSSIGRYTGVQHCSAGPAQSRQKYPKIGQISGLLIFLDNVRVEGTPALYFGDVETKTIGIFSRKTPFCRLFEFWEKTATKIIGAWLLLRITTAPSFCLASLHYHGLVLIIFSLHLPVSSSWPLLCITTVLSSWLELLHHHSLIQRVLVPINAALHLLGLVLITVSLHLHGVVLCAACGHDSMAAPPRPQPLVSFTSGRQFLLDSPIRGWGLLLLDPPHWILSRAPAHFSPDDSVLEVVAAPSCSAPDDAVRGVKSPFVPG